jgi:hypothetical protein
MGFTDNWDGLPVIIHNALTNPAFGSPACNIDGNSSISKVAGLEDITFPD